MSGGLDALENLGKKTMEVLTEGDPGELSQVVHGLICVKIIIFVDVAGLREKRSMMGGGKTPTLSELLQEAKADSEGQGRSGETSGAGGEHTPLTYSRLFDEYKGALKNNYCRCSLLMFTCFRCGAS